MFTYIANIETQTKENNDYRKVIYTEPKKGFQLVLMSLKPGEEIGAERHPHTTQFFRFESGTGEVIVNGQKHNVSDGFAVVIPPNTLHNVKNTNTTEPLKLYTIYTPAEHGENVVQVHKTDPEMPSNKKGGGGQRSNPGGINKQTLLNQEMMYYAKYKAKYEAKYKAKHEIETKYGYK